MASKSGGEKVRFYIVKEETKTKWKESVRSIPKCVCMCVCVCYVTLYYKGVWVVEPQQNFV